jgi:hypothetical protein
VATIASQISIILSLVAAGLWGWSAVANLPVISGTYTDIDNLGAFYVAMKKVARLNAGAAICTFASAVAQAAALSLSG